MRTSRNRLSPPEAWFSAWMLSRQQAHRTAPVLRLEQNYGPEGVPLVAAALLWGWCEILVGVLFLVLLVASGGGSVLTDILLGLVGVLFCLAVFRIRQAAIAGRRFRGDRPFAKK